MSSVKPNRIALAVMAYLLFLPVTSASAQAPAAAPAALPAPVPAAPETAASAPSEPLAAPVAVPAAPAAPAGDVAAATSPVPPAPPAPQPPPLSMQQFSASPPRVVFLVPQKRAVRPRPAAKHGDAGAPFSAGMGLTLSWPADAGYGIAELEEPQRRLELFGSYDLWQPTERLVIAAGASFRTLLGGDDSRAEIRERAWLGELSARYALTVWLFPHLRVAGGAVGTEISIRDEALAADGKSGVSFEDRDWAAMGSVGAGFTLRTKARTFETHSGRMSSLSFGVLVEGGYSFAPAMKVTLDPTGTPSSGVKLTPADLGSLDRSAPYLRIAGVARF